mgnify:CR=1 FL=1
MAQQTWFIVRGEKEEGPYTGTVLKEMASSGKLKPTDMVRRGDVESARTANQIKGLFPAAGSQEVASVPDKTPDHPHQPTSKRKWLVISVAVAAVLLLSCAGLFGLGLFLMNSERQAAKKDYAEANELWDVGKKEESAVKYRGALKGLRGEEKAMAYGRLIDHECEAGNTEAAKSLVADAAKAKIIPSVNHPDAKKLLASVQASSQQEGSAPADAKGDVLTADYLPCIAGNMKVYTEERYDFDSGRPANRTTDKITFHGDNKYTLEWSTASPGQAPTTGKGSDKFEVRGGMVIWLGRITIKVRAKPGDEWPGTGKLTYKLVRFEKAEAKGGGGKVIELQRAVIESRLVSDDGRGGKTEHVTEYVLEKGGGIQSEKEYMTARGRKVLIRERRLSSSSYQ